MYKAGQEPRLIALNKPFDVLCQFSDSEGRTTLKEFVPVTDVYPAGRLDKDSEGLVLLTNDGKIQHYFADPGCRQPKTYIVQVEGAPRPEQLAQLCAGVDLGDFVTRPCQAAVMTEPHWLWPRNPPVRFRKTVPTGWLQIILHEGKNRQVRRMTARVGLPALRLIRTGIGLYTLDGLQPGQWAPMPLPQLKRRAR